MRELHVVALSEDGRHVVLATRAGTASGEFRVALDERLTAAVRGELPAPGRDAPPSISPRDIQTRLRDGETPEEIAASAGVPLSRVERYAGPVLAELDRMVTGARAATVTRPRLGASALPLGEAVESHLAEVANLAEGSVRWSARRTDAGRWVVEVSWTARGRRRTAGWYYDPAGREVVAVDGPSAVLGHVEDGAAPAAAGSRSTRPAAAAPPVQSAGRAAAPGTPRSPAGTPATARAVRSAAAPAAPSPRQTRRPPTTATPAAAPTPAAPAAAAPPAPAARRRATAASAPARRRTAPLAAAATPPPPPTATTATSASATSTSTAAPARRAPARRGAAAGQAPAPGTATTARDQSRRSAPRRSPVPPLDGLPAAPTAPAEPATPATTSPAGTAPAGTPPGAPDAPDRAPAGPPLLRVVPPAAPEPVPADDVAQPPEARPVRRAAGQRSGGRDWADVLMGTAPPAPAAQRED